MKTDFENIIDTVIQGDCLEVMRQLPDQCVDLVLTDPPYEFISKKPYGGGFMTNENKKYLDRIKDSFGMSYCPELYLAECQRVLRKFNGYFFTNKSLLVKYICFAEQNKYKWDILIWHKPNPVPINNWHYLFDKEYIVYIRESGATFNSDLGYKSYCTIKSHPIGTKETSHPTEKPLSILRDLICVSTNENDIVFDGYLGSGTTAVACYHTRRRYIGIELNDGYAEMARKRIQAEKEKMALFNEM